LSLAVAVLGVVVFLASFFKLFATGSDSAELILGVVAALLAGLLAGVGLLPKQKYNASVVAVLAVVGFLLVIAVVITTTGVVATGWPLISIIIFTAFEAIFAVVALLLDAGVIRASGPRPKFESPAPPFAPYGGAAPFFGQPGPPVQPAVRPVVLAPQAGPTLQAGPPPHAGPPLRGPAPVPPVPVPLPPAPSVPGPQPMPKHLPQRPPYPAPFGGYAAGATTGGFSALGPDGGPPTPPTGFPVIITPKVPASAPEVSDKTISMPPVTVEPEPEHVPEAEPADADKTVIVKAVSPAPSHEPSHPRFD
jgi:hypothetical protein